MSESLEINAGVVGLGETDGAIQLSIAFANSDGTQFRHRFTPVYLQRKVVGAFSGRKRLSCGWFNEEECGSLMAFLVIFGKSPFPTSIFLTLIEMNKIPSDKEMGAILPRHLLPGSAA